MKEGKRLIFPGLHSWLSYSMESARNREIKRERDRERKEGRKKGRKEGKGTQALMKQRYFNQHGVGIYTALQGIYSQQR